MSATTKTAALRGTLIFVATIINLFYAVPVHPQSAVRCPAPYHIQFPSRADSTSPLTWLDGTLYIYTSVVSPVRSSGPDLSNFSIAQAITLRGDGPAGPFPDSVWFESVYRSATDPNRLYSWYHHEVQRECSQGTLAEPAVGAAVSDDNGMSWQNLGMVLMAPPGSYSCTYQNGYFVGGHGDFSVIKQGSHFYIFYSNYAQPFEQQGVSVARMHEADLDAPVGRAFKYYNGDWTSPGLGGPGTPIWPAAVSWEQYNPDSYWGPSLHYNYYLGSYVILMNRAVAHGWRQEGIYYSFNANLDNPAGWSAPARLNLEPSFDQWYPQAVGLGVGETNDYLGSVGRLYISGFSDDYIRFFRPGETPVCPSQQPSEPIAIAFSISPDVFSANEQVTATATLAPPNSTVRLVEEKLIEGRWQVVYDNGGEGTTDGEGRWTYPGSYIPGLGLGPYRAYVVVAGVRSPAAYYELIPCP